MESTFGDNNHEKGKNRSQLLQSIIKTVLENKGAVLILAFIIGHAQKLFYGLEEVKYKNSVRASLLATNKPELEANQNDFDCSCFEGIVDGPLL